MGARVAIVITVLVGTGAAAADPMNVDVARRLIVGKTFSYTCFDGSRGAGRIYSDGSITGTIQVRGSGPMRHAALPAGTVRVRGEASCASLRGMPFEPTFTLHR